MNLFSPLWRRRRGRLDDVALDSFLVDEGFVALDLETTGLDPDRDAIVEVAAVAFVDGRPQSRYVTRVDPGVPIPPETTRIHGITDAMVAGAPELGTVLGQLESMCADRLLVGHGIGFDLRVLARARRARGLSPITNAALDTMRLAVTLHPDWARQSFDEVTARMGIGVLGRHTAEGDALGAGELLLGLIPEIQALGARTVGDLLWLQESSDRGS